MRKQTRRQVIGGGILAALAFPFRSLTGATEQAVEKTAADSSRRRALTAVRVITTAQLVILKKKGQFATLEEMGQPDVEEMIRQFYKPEVLEGIKLGKVQVLPGFSASVTVSPDRRSYKLFVIEDSEEAGRRFGYSSDQEGAIREGTVSAVPGESPGQSFKGEPIKKTAHGRPSNEVLAAGMAILAFFVPTVHALDRCGSCAQCYNGDAHDCGVTCGPLCCSLGYDDCRWCCKSFASCDCPS